MKVLERLALIDKIGRELQSRMTFADIDVYLTAYGVDCKDRIPSANSKYVYVKEVLSDVPEDTVVRIADELEIHHTFAVATQKEATCWKPGHFRLFLSHLASFKKQTTMLQAALKRYAISSFVAHVDIEPSKEWQEEIESALHTMDALVAVLMPGFKESNWCDQEVGFAVGRGVLVVPLRRELDPYGFIGKYQGIQAVGKTVGQVADEIFQVLVRSGKTRAKVISALSTQVAQATTVGEAMDTLEVLSSLESLPSEVLEKVRGQVIENAVLSDSSEFQEALYEVLARYGIEEIGVGVVAEADEWDDSLPF